MYTHTYTYAYAYAYVCTHTYACTLTHTHTYFYSPHKTKHIHKHSIGGNKAFKKKSGNLTGQVFINKEITQLHTEIITIFFITIITASVGTLSSPSKKSRNKS